MKIKRPLFLTTLLLIGCVGTTVPSIKTAVPTTTLPTASRAKDGMVYIPGGTFQMGSSDEEIEDAIRASIAPDTRFDYASFRCAASME